MNTSNIKVMVLEREESLRRERAATEANQNIFTASERTRRLIAEIYLLKELADTKYQVEEYDDAHGAGSWENTFVRVDDGALKRTWKNKRGERFQRIFVDPEHRVVPRLPQGGLEKFSMQGFLVNPDRVSTALMTKTGMAKQWEFDAVKGDPIERIVIKDAAINGVKKMFDEAVPVVPNQERILRIAPPKEHDKYPDDTPHVSREAVGGILCVREKVNGTDGPRDMIVQVFEGGVYDALRKTHHVESGYDDEIDMLAECQCSLDAIRARLDRGYRRGVPDTEKEALWRQAEAAILRSERALGAPQAPQKVKAQELLGKASILEDKRGTKNVSSVMTRITSALDKLDVRMSTEIRQKGGYNAQDRMILQGQIRVAERTMLAARHLLQDAAVDLETGIADPERIRKDLEATVRELELIKLKPLALPAETMIRQIQALTPNDRPAFRDQLLTGHDIGKIQGLISALNYVHGKTAKSGTIDYADAADYMRRVEQAFRSEQILPGHSVPRLKAVMEPLGQEIAEFRAYLERNAANPPAAHDRKKAKEILVGRLERFDTESALGAISLGLPEAVPYEAPYALTNSK